jgi:N-acetylmuramoyl-L-alanine amidase/Secretion system C-terminal sorting domain
MKKTILPILVLLFSVKMLFAQMEGKNIVFDFAKVTPSKAAKTLIKKTTVGKTYTLTDIKMPLSKPDPFVTLSIRLEGTNLDHDNLELSFVEDESKTWQVIHHNHEGTSTPTRLVSELLYLDKGLKKITLKIEVKNSNTRIKSANVRFFSPGNVSTGDVSPKESYLPCDRPAIVGRNVWGAGLNLSDDRIFSGSPSFTTVSHLIVHHAAGTNTSSNWAAVVLSILDFHVNSNGWADVGYNYLIAPTGQIFTGRGGGDNVVGAHFCGFNGGTMGVCLLGNYMAVAPTDTMMGSLAKILAWKAVQRGINPTGSSFHASSNRTLNHISGHRDGCATSCPGDLAYPLLPNLRQRVGALVASGCAVGNQDVTGVGSLSVFPNPSTEGRFSVQLNLLQSAPSVWRVFDAVGRLVFQKKVDNPSLQFSETLDLQGFARGVYFLNIALGDKMISEKIVFN